MSPTFMLGHNSREVFVGWPGVVPGSYREGTQKLFDGGEQRIAPDRPLGMRWRALSADRVLARAADDIARGMSE